MDWLGNAASGLKVLRQYRYALLIVAAGILLLILPGREGSSDTVRTEPAPQTQPSLEESLSQILCQIEGAGRVAVLLTEARGEETIYQADENSSSGDRSADRRSDTVLITGSDRRETGLIRQVNPPVYRGAVIVCQGAGNPQVRLAVVQAAMRVTGLTSDKITVLKMK